MPITYTKGDLLKLINNFDIIVHGCNCFHTFGAGIAKQIKSKFPQAYQADLSTKYADKSKLGTYSLSTHNNTIIINAYIQFNYGTSKPQLNYQALTNCLTNIATNYPNKSIAMPKIGCGLAGGDWKTVEKIITETLKNHQVTIVEYLI
jgi:O-acetyl-ADP-ribose deacetylase (regulator of RNase III)